MGINPRHYFLGNTQKKYIDKSKSTNIKNRVVSPPRKMRTSSDFWNWKGHMIHWTYCTTKDSDVCVLLIHGFGANTNHWRFNQPVLAELAPTYAIDLLGFGRSDQPRARLKDEPVESDVVHYGFDLWGQQVADLADEIVQRPGTAGRQLHRRGRCPAGSTTARGKLPGRGTDRLRPAIDG